MSSGCHAVPGGVITDRRFDPVSRLGSGDEDGVLDALAGLAAGSVSLMGPSYSVRSLHHLAGWCSSVSIAPGPLPLVGCPGYAAGLGLRWRRSDQTASGAAMADGSSRAPAVGSRLISGRNRALSVRNAVHATA